MNSSEKNQLLNDLLGGDELGRVRDATLARGLEALRRRARRRRQFQAAAIMAPLLCLAVAWHFRPAGPPRLEATAPPPPVAESGKVKYITQSELFALFPNRPIALIGPPGHQQFLLLDELERNPKQ